MRMWMIEPKVLCQKHLCGCHLEIHMFIGSIKKGYKMDGYIKNNLLEPACLKTYHDLLSEEMLRRGYKHKSVITSKDMEVINILPSYQKKYKINIEFSLKDLLSRCRICNNRYLNLQSETK